ncbi:amino acid adenylation domain-containing protein [Lysobacter yangpyeongensis]
MRIDQAIEALAEAGVYLAVQDGKLICKAAPGALTPERRQFISDRKTDFLAFLDAGDVAMPGDSEPVLAPRGAGDAMLSPAQKRLWFIDRLTGANYIIPVTYRLTGPLDAHALARALHRIVERHESLRTVVGENDGEPIALIRDAEGFEFECEDIRALDRDARESHVRNRLQAAITQSFDLARDLPLRACLFQLAEREHVLLLTLHHIASDGWSVENLLRELSVLYAAFIEARSDPLPPLALHYADYAAWQLQWLQGERLHRELAYWRDRLAGAPAVHGLPLDFPRPSHAVHVGATWRQQLPAALHRALGELSRHLGATLFMTLQTAFAVLIARWSGESDVVVGTPVANRPRDELAPLIGFFANTLALRSSLPPDMPFAEAVREARSTALDAYKYQHLPFEVLVEDLNPPRSLNHAPLFQLMFSLLDIDEASAIDLPGITAEAILPDCSNAKFDLGLTLFENAGGLEACWDYSTELFRNDTIARLGASFEALLRGIVADPAQRIGDLPLLDDAAQGQVLALGVGEAADYPLHRCLHELVEAQVARSPDAVAVTQGDEALTYGELNEEANRLAHHLRALGVRPEMRVGIVMPRCPRLMVAVLAVMKAGGAYVPIEPDHPDQRLAYMLDDCAPAVVLTLGDSTDRVRSLLSATGKQPSAVLDIVADAAAWSDRPLDNPRPEDVGLTPRNLVYVIYTSGSTGQPKGVMNEHRGVANRMLWMQQAYPLAPQDRVLQKTPIGFDVSVREIFHTLIAGARMVQARTDGHRDPGYLIDLIARERVNVVGFVPSMLQAFLDHPRARTCTGIQRIFCGGETLPGALARRCRAEFPDAQLHNLYGPTEAAVSVTAWDCPREGIPDIIPIGRPGANTRIYILDERGAPVPRGVRGEIHIAGCQVARGYLNRPELTAERFLDDPFHPGDDARMYRTGDLGRQWADGNIEYLGRNDFQVKIRGQRVELGEIEAQLRNLAGVGQAAVVVRDVGDGGPALVAYVVAADDADTSVRTGQWRRQLQAVLPAHMVPSMFVLVPAMPVTANGKLDLNALPAPDGDDASPTLHEPPRSPLEARLADMWRELLQRERVGVTDNFFELGGHSLLLTRLSNQILAHCAIELPLKQLFAAQTVREQARLIESREPSAREATGVAPKPRPKDAPPVLSFAQRRLWFIDQMGEAGAVYNIPCALRLRGTLDVEALHAALYTVVQRHEVLRTPLVAESGEAVPQLRDSFDVRLDTHDLESQPDRDDELRRRIDEEAARPFDLASDLFLRAQLLRLSANEHVLLMTVHHIAADGWSMGVLLHEIAESYNAREQGREAALAPLPLQYADYAHWQQEWLQGERLDAQLRYWEDQLAGLPVVHNLPLDFPRPETQRYRGAMHWQRMPAELLAGLQQLARKHDATSFMVLHAAFAVLLSRWSGDADIVIGTPIANRRHEALAPLVGFFVNTLVLRTGLDPQASFVEALRHTRSVALDAYQHQDLPFEMLVDRLRPARSLAHSPLFQVMLAFDNNGSAIVPLEGLDVSDAAGDSHHAKFDLTLNLRETAEGLEACWDYNRDLFRPDTIARMGATFETLLQGIVRDPDRRVGELPLMEGALADEAETACALPNVTGVHELFEANARRVPERIAARDGSREIRYCDLDASAARIADALQAAGVGADRCVALHMERGIDMLAGMLGILKAGGAYVPLDPAHPRERLAAILRDSGATVLLTQSALRQALPADGTRVLCVEDLPSAAPLAEGRRTMTLQRSNLAYVLYTSGSTGAPKGVMVEHGNLLNLVHHACTEFADNGPVEASLWTSLGFDVSVFEVFVALALGATVHLVPEEIRADPDALLQWFAAQGITQAYLPPFVVRRWREIADERIAALSLRRLLVGVEPLVEADLHRLMRLLPGLSVVNGYGPTETTVYCTSYADIRDRARNAPIGRPIANTQIHLLDASLQPVPPGVVGEIHVSGLGVARGYLNRPDLTRESFIEHPSGRRLYRTGDLARWSAEGQLEFHGRRDQQVKVNGVRIEPREIETALCSHPGVNEAAVLARETGPDRDRRLVAYLLCREDRPEPGALREHLAQHLPAYMIPSAFVLLDAWPLTVSGKLDARALPEPDLGAYAASEYTPPETPLERQIAAIWQGLLGHERISVTANFFDLGGHSLNAVRLMSSIRECTGKSLPISILFQAPTIRALAAQVIGYQPSAGESFIVLREGNTMPPLFLFHAAGGDVVCYHPLLRHLTPGVPVCGFHRSELPNQRVPMFKSVEELAEVYLARLLRQQPEGPYRLAGWSSGGLLALEVASRLESMGRNVAGVALIDTMLATGTGIPERFHTLGLDALQQLSPDEACELMREFDPTLPMARPGGEILDVPASDYFNYLVAANQIGLEFHKPRFVLDAPVSYFGCSQNRNFKTVVQRVEEIQALVRGPIVCREFDATHFSIMEEPHVTELGPALAASLGLS